ncbi:immunoglobulin-like domain-containing protein [uncultured Clostridium sp.]|uniref:immunoglobulin-like domain-containing protein n=1 Tax=uncultured Clostridium sp. TaxID=59620 RepID=UPI00272C43CF|nr:immunoglobulin-like domain-containing protein [uncultured Clostridium sp.]
MEQITEQEKKLLEYYYDKQKKKKAIILGVIVGIIIVLLIYIGFSINTQTKWDFREENITIEYGTPYKANLGALVDTSKYQFMTYDNTTIITNMENEKDKEYAPVGNYTITITYSGQMKILGLSKQVTDEKSIDVQVKDTTAPKLSPPEKIEILVGQKFETKQYAYLFKVEDFSKTDDIKFDISNINTNTVGEYKLLASVEDRYGNKSECEVTVSVIEDPYKEEEILEPIPEPTPTSNNTSETTTTQPVQKEPSTEKSKPNKSNKEYKNKDFLFSDGYTMSTVSEAAYNYLKESGKSGECIPIQDDEGLYIGMRVIIYN